MIGSQVVPNALNALVGKIVDLTMYGEHVFSSCRGELDAVVGNDNYIIRTKRDDVTIRFSVHNLDAIDTSRDVPAIYVLVDQQPSLRG